MPQRDVEKILVLRFSSLGDIVMTTAMVRCLRLAYPKARIDYVVRSDFFDLIRENPHITHKYSLDRNEGVRAIFKLKRQINQTGYDLIYDAHRSLRTLFLMPFLRARFKAYYKKHYLRRSLALVFKLRILDSRRFLEKFIEPLKRFGVQYDGKGPEMFLKGTSSFIPDKSRSWVAFIPSAQWPGKRWPTQRFHALAKALLEKTDLGIIVFGGKSDTFCKEIVQGLPPDRILNMQGKLSLMESSLLLTHCQFTVANDTGLMHVADALNIPSVLFLGPTSKESGCLPFQPQTKVLEHTLWCRPCSKNGEAPCIRKERYCLTLTSVEDTFKTVLDLKRELGAS